MKISVLIPTYNRKNLAALALNQIIKYDNDSILEVIVSDNHSDDDSFEYLKNSYRAHKKIRIIQPPIKCAPLKNWKYCLEQATGTHLHWHWSDDVLISDFYSKALDLYNKHGHNVICGPVRIRHEDGFTPVFYSQGFDRSLDSKSALNLLITSGRFSYSPAAYILPKASVLNHFYEDLPDYEDLRPVEIAMGPDALMIAGAMMENPSIGFCDEPIMEFNKHSGSITEQNISSFRCYHLAFCFFIKKNMPDIFSARELVDFYGYDLIQNIYSNEFLSRLPRKAEDDLLILNSSLWVRLGKRFGLC
jgi:glycosyltransferase involved in cell wall biosynthesis